jgi:hypothetical protein
MVKDGKGCERGLANGDRTKDGQATSSPVDPIPVSSRSNMLASCRGGEGNPE